MSHEGQFGGGPPPIDQPNTTLYDVNDAMVETYGLPHHDGGAHFDELEVGPGPSTEIGLGVIGGTAMDDAATVATAPASSKRWCPYVTGGEPFANNLYPISAIAFDPVHELLWSGNESVDLVSASGRTRD